ncbi:hypothetical protein, partial [Vibrio sp. 10N.222.49.E5]|uniref:hypothetical protein n=1 Tax=Vibrio sp. 10N.222.49.E5 TaxID=3229617 RepID=UPI00355808A0
FTNNYIKPKVLVFTKNLLCIRKKCKYVSERTVQLLSTIAWPMEGHSDLKYADEGFLLPIDVPFVP